jgi:DNA-binding FadR family transcriptional regulator
MILVKKGGHMRTKKKILEVILCRIASGELPGGSELPNLIAMAKEYGTSKGTMVAVMDMLKKIEMVSSKQGGCFRLCDGAKGIARNEIRSRLKEAGEHLIAVARAANVALNIKHDERTEE